MKKAYIILLTILIATVNVNAQKVLSQSIKGQILDDISRAPVEGATISLLSDSLQTTKTGKDGLFSLLAEVGMHSISISFLGYEERVINEILVTTGKEVIIKVLLTEKISHLEEVIVKAGSKRVVNNEMAVVSAHTFNAEDTRRFAGTLGDPSRMIAGFAGVTSSNDSRNDIIVRGNSPTGLLWQMEGIDIPNPNHYGSLSSTGGPVSLLNNNNLGKSDFLTGAFPAQYGNAISSVFDLRLRDGNPDKTEFLAEISFTGFEAGAEGPIVKGKGSSYLFNYRYSTLGVLNTFGLNFGTGKAVPQYQDLTFKILLPVSERSKLVFFGLGGPSKVNFLAADADNSDDVNLYGADNENLYTNYATGIIGSTLETTFNNKTFGKLSIGASMTAEKILHDIIDVNTKIAFRDEEHKYGTRRYSLNYILSHKLNSRNSLVIGTNNTLISFDLFDKRILGNGKPERVTLDQNDQMLLFQTYAQWKHRFTEGLSLNAGLHFQTLTLNQTSALEPRIGLKYVARNKNVLSFGYGMHSLMQSPLIYFYQTNVNGALTFTNKNLKFTKSHHFIGSYDHNLSKTIHLKTELYYQKINNAPVDTPPNGFSLLNEGAGFGISKRDSLINNGDGRNYGIELTLEKFFTKGSYLLFSTSLFDTKYKGSDGILRNSAFNTKYAANLLFGKDFKAGKNNNVISANIKLTTVGGKYISPINIPASQNNYKTVYDEIVSPFSLRQKLYFKGDLKLGYRKNNKQSTLEVGVNVQNFTMHKNIFIEKYDKQTNEIVIEYQQDFLPVPFFRLTF